MLNFPSTHKDNIPKSRVSARASDFIRLTLENLLVMTCDWASYSPSKDVFLFATSRRLVSFLRECERCEESEATQFCSGFFKSPAILLLVISTNSRQNRGSVDSSNLALGPQSYKDLRYTAILSHMTYSANRSLSSCSELPLPRLATNSVEHGGFPRLAMW